MPAQRRKRITPGITPMGTVRKRGDKWRAEICVKGQRRSKTCRTKAAAEQWCKATEQAITSGPANTHTLGDALDRYGKTYSVRKRTHKAEIKRLDRLGEALGRDTLLSGLTADTLTQWRDSRLDAVTPGSVRRDWSLLHHVLTVTVREWEWMPSNPLDSVTRPSKPLPRTRVWSDADIETYLHCAGWPGDSLTAKTGDCLLFALETAMRAGEITGLNAEHIHTKHVHLPRTKNGSARDVPLSTKAREILDRYPDGFGLTGSQLNSLFRKVRDRARLKDLRFHDARRTALTRLSKKLDALELARVSGHRDLRILLSTYYQPTIEDLAGRLD